MVSPTNTQQNTQHLDSFNTLADNISMLINERSTFSDEGNHDMVNLYNREIQSLQDQMHRVSDNYMLFMEPGNRIFMENNPEIIREMTEDPTIVSNDDILNRLAQLRAAAQTPPSTPPSTPSTPPRSPPRSPTGPPPRSLDINARGNKKNKTKANKNKSKKCCPKKCCSKRCRTKKCRAKKCCSKKIHNKKCRSKKCRYRKCCSKKSRK